MASTGADDAWYAQYVPGCVDAVQADRAPLYEPPIMTQGALVGLLFRFKSNGKRTCLAKLVKSLHSRISYQH